MYANSLNKAESTRSFSHAIQSHYDAANISNPQAGQLPCAWEYKRKTNIKWNKSTLKIVRKSALLCCKTTSFQRKEWSNICQVLQIDSASASTSRQPQLGLLLDFLFQISIRAFKFVVSICDVSASISNRRAQLTQKGNRGGHCCLELNLNYWPSAIWRFDNAKTLSDRCLGLPFSC